MYIQGMYMYVCRMTCVWRMCSICATYILAGYLGVVMLVACVHSTEEKGCQQMLNDFRMIMERWDSVGVILEYVLEC